MQQRNRIIACAFRRGFLLAAGLLLVTGMHVEAQTLRGKVVSNTAGTESPLPGAIVRWISSGDGGTTDSTGSFSIPLPTTLPQRLAVSLVGFSADTLTIQGPDFLQVNLKPAAELQEVEVTARKEALSVSTLQTIQAEKITQKELLKAACCNLSEAFETNPTVNVAYTDAVTGAREVQLLGLSGIYSQMLFESVPSYRGLAAPYGLTFVPGPWMESIQVTKGSGSVVNGFDGAAGQLNIEFIKPDNDEFPRFFVNAFGEPMGYTDVNAYRRFALGEHWSTVLMVHGNRMFTAQDRNKDGWMDMPMGQQVNAYNRWQYHSRKKLEAQLGFRFLYDERDGGQMSGEGGGNHHGGDYVTHVDNMRMEAFGKLGLINPDKPFRSIGNTVHVSKHRMQAAFGFRTYEADQTSLFAQSVYQNAFNQRQHEIRAGLSLRYDLLTEIVSGVNDTLEELVPGAFAEYTWHYLDRFTLVAGIRGDHHNIFGGFATPRLHLKYDFTSDLVLRASAGNSFRVPYRVAENLPLMVSSRRFEFRDELRPERAWTFGLNLTHKFRLFERDGYLLLDLYHTDFTDQLVVDRYSDSARFIFYNLQGRSYSNSAQLTFSHQVLRQLELRLAFKVDDVRTDYLVGNRRKPLVPYQRALMTLHYESDNSRWLADYTLVWTGMKALPATFTDPIQGVYPDESPDFVTMNFQLTRAFKRLECYAGSENFLDFRQPSPVINRDDPYSDRFDATNVWGPVLGRRIYAGIRFKWH